MFRGPVKWRGSVEVDSLSKRTWSLSAFSEICAHVGIRVQVGKQGQACVVGQVAYRRDDRVVVSDENKAALGDLVDTLLAQILGSVARELLGKFVGKRDVIGLELLDARRVGVGESDGREGLAGSREGGVVDTGDLGAEGHREGRLGVLDLHVVEHDRLEVAHGLRRAIERGELALLEDRAEGFLGGRPRAAVLLEAEVVEGRLDRDDKVALERVLRRGDAEVVTFLQRRLWRGGRIGNLHGSGGRVDGLLLADGHFWKRGKWMRCKVIYSYL